MYFLCSRTYYNRQILMVKNSWIMSIGIWLVNLMVRLFSKDMDGPLVLFDTIFSRFAMSSSFLPMFSEFWLAFVSRASISSELPSMTTLLIPTSFWIPLSLPSFFSISSLLFARLVWRIVISFLISSMSSITRVSFMQAQINPT